MIGLLSEAILEKNPGEKVVHDARAFWNTLDQVTKAGGVPIQSKGGHAFIKETMRKVNAVYGGEMSAHHFFRDFGYCDSGMVPWLLLTQMMSKQNKTLAQLVDERIEAYPVSGEINVTVDNPLAILASLKQHYAEMNTAIDEIDGLSMDFGQWRFNVRPSNTEPLLRMNVETKAAFGLMEEKRDELLALISH